MSHEKLIEKIRSEFIKHDNSFIQSLSNKISEVGFPQDMICNGSEESKKAISDWISILVDISSAKKSSPKSNNSPKKEAWVDPKELILKVREQQAVLDAWDGEGDSPEIKQWCLHRALKGVNKNKSCGKELTGPPASGNIYANKCTACSKNNSEKAIIKLQDFYESLLAGSEVKGSPTGNYNVPADEVPDFNVAEMAGIKDGVTSPTTGPKEFLNGKAEGIPSPSGAKGKKRSPKNFKLREIKIGKTDEYHDCYSKEDVNGNTWMVRKTIDPVKYEVGGKFSGIKSEFDENYLNELQEIEGDEMEMVSKIGLEYRFLGKTASVESDEEENESGDEEIDDLLNSI